MSKTLFKGVGVAMVTPFDAAGAIALPVLDRYIEHLISGGAAALLPFGTTGEPSTLTHSEYEFGIGYIVEKVNGRLPVIVGAGSNSTAAAARKVELAKKSGADGVLVVTPYYNKCTQRGIVEHYKRVAEVGLPVIVYNVPSRTGVDIAPCTLAELAEIENIVGVKEANGNIAHIQQTAKVCAETGLDMYSGDDGLTFVQMMLGAKGVISVAANVAPEPMSELAALCLAGNIEKARKLQFRLDPFIETLFCEVNPIPVKKALQLIGLDVGAPRLPLTELEPDHTLKLSAEMHEVGII